MILLALIFPFVGLIPASQQTAQQQPNRPPSIDSFFSSLTRIEICPFFPSSVVTGKPEVTLIVNATDPDGDSLNYEYSTTEGTISGKGKSVVWDLNGLPRGSHEVRVTVNDGKGGKVDAALTVITADAGVCDPPPPPCPAIKVSCPDEMDKSKPFTFSSLVEADAAGRTPSSFHWKINAGRIVKGQNSRSIEVTGKGANGFDNITATVEVGGFDPACATIVSCTTKIIW
jgi:Big-like domain-containing protein